MTIMKFIQVLNLREESAIVYLAVHIGFFAKFQWGFVCCNRFPNTVRTACPSVRFQIFTTTKVVWFQVTTVEKGMKRRGSCQICLDFSDWNEWEFNSFYTYNTKLLGSPIFGKPKLTNGRGSFPNIDVGTVSVRALRQEGKDICCWLNTPLLFVLPVVRREGEGRSWFNTSGFSRWICEELW